MGPPCHAAPLDLAGSTLEITQIQSYTYTPIGTVFLTWATGTSYRVRVQAAGGTVRAKKWAVGDTEPAAWAVTATATVVASGYWGFFVAPGTTKAAYTAVFDDVITS